MYSSSNIIRMMDRICSPNGGEEACIKDIGGKARREEATRKTKT
jgi:hypothetical protein